MPSLNDAFIKHHVTISVTMPTIPVAVITYNVLVIKWEMVEVPDKECRDTAEGLEMPGEALRRLVLGVHDLGEGMEGLVHVA